MITSHGRLVSSRLSRRSHPDCRATPRCFCARSALYRYLLDGQRPSGACAGRAKGGRKTVLRRELLIPLL
jgi:hypothetical protein